jgi:hypothetical protein
MAGNKVRYGSNGPGNQAPGRSASILTRTASRGRYSIKFRSTCIHIHRAQITFLVILPCRTNSPKKRLKKEEKERGGARGEPRRRRCVVKGARTAPREVGAAPGVCPLSQIFSARMAHGVFRAEVLAEQRLRGSAPITPGSRSKSAAQGTYLPPIASW